MTIERFLEIQHEFELPAVTPVILDVFEIEYRYGFDQDTALQIVREQYKLDKV